MAVFFIDQQTFSPPKLSVFPHADTVQRKPDNLLTAMMFYHHADNMGVVVEHFYIRNFVLCSQSFTHFMGEITRVSVNGDKPRFELVDLAEQGDVRF